MTARKVTGKVQKPIRVGVVGIWRGGTFAAMAAKAGMQLVALCESQEERLKKAADRFKGVSLYSDYDQFLSHDMDAVVIANYCHQHAPLAIKALKAGLHVMSEVVAVKTLGEAVALVRAVEKSKKIYMMAENYCYFASNQQMRQIYREKEIGEVQFAECEYIHPVSPAEMAHLAPGMNHWRNWLPSTYYCTHALGPIMYITDTRPLYVNAQSIPYIDSDPDKPLVRRGDIGSTILCKMDNQATVVVNGLFLKGHGVWYRLHGTRGIMESLRTNRNQVRVFHDHFDRVPNQPNERIFTAEFPTHAREAGQAGHSGGDFFTNWNFAEAIRTGRQPWLDIYRALDMSVVGIQAWKSALEKGAPQEIPDFRTEAARRKYAKENWSPYPEDAGPGQPPPSILGIREPTARQIAASRKLWAKDVLR